MLMNAYEAARTLDEAGEENAKGQPPKLVARAK